MRQSPDGCMQVSAMWAIYGMREDSIKDTVVVQTRRKVTSHAFNTLIHAFQCLFIDILGFLWRHREEVLIVKERFPGQSP
jgi:hypothetical protein